MIAFIKFKLKKITMYKHKLNLYQKKKYCELDNREWEEIIIKYSKVGNNFANSQK